MTATYREFRTATREFELTDGKHCFAYGEVRYTFTVTPGRPAKTWARAADDFGPAEAPAVSISLIEWRWGTGNKAWIIATDHFGDLLAEVPDAWFLEQIEEQEA
jgi:hypothetical protein